MICLAQRAGRPYSEFMTVRWQQPTIFRLSVVVPPTDLPVVGVVGLASQRVDGFAFVELGVDPAAVFFVVEVPQDRDGLDDPAVLLDGLGESVLKT